MVVYNIIYITYIIINTVKWNSNNRIPQSIENIKCVSDSFHLTSGKYKMCKEYKSNLQHGRKYIIYIRDMNNGE
jgi:hypothetical protein